MRFHASSLAAEIDGVLHGDDVTCDGLAIDSRDLKAGQLFAALVGERDGHEFVPAARAAGAPVVLVQRRVDDGVSLVVPDVRRALVELAHAARKRLPELVVGVTGSVGKTTTKDMLASVLGRRFVTAASAKSFNNELGVPLTLANASDATTAVVVEMGARGHGHIAELCEMARPSVGVITAVAAVHTELMGDEDRIAVAKRELVECLPAGGLAVLNADDPRVAAMAGNTRAAVLSFSTGADSGGRHVAEVRAEETSMDRELRPRFRLVSPWGSAEVHLGARGVHNVANALAAATVGLWAGVPIEATAEALAEPIGSPWRMELTRTASGATVLNDSYNAGPASMAAALRSLGALPARRRVAVLGAMAELGGRAAEEHRRVAELAAELDIEIVAVGTTLYGCDPVAGAGSPEDFPVVVQVVLDGEDPGGTATSLAEGTAVLVKGSRVSGLEVLAQALLGTGSTP